MQSKFGGDAIVFSYTKLNVNFVVLIITIIIVVLANYTFKSISSAYSSSMKNTEKSDYEFNINMDESVVGEENAVLEQEEIIEQEKTEIKVIEDSTDKIEISNSKKLWQIEIPKIKLTAPIASGTTEKVLNKDVGHFEHTSKWDGNVGLAAHNNRIPSKLF